MPSSSSDDDTTDDEEEFTLSQNTKTILVQFMDESLGVTTMTAFHKPKFPADKDCSFSDLIALLDNWINKRTNCVIR